MNMHPYQLPFYEPKDAKKPTESRQILLIVNPVSGRMKTKTGLFEILDELYRLDKADSVDGKSSGKTAGIASPLPFGTLTSTTLGGDKAPDRRVTVIPTMHRGHAIQMAANSSKEGYDTVICCGGDGTLNETISGLLMIPADHRPVLGYIPAGSTNDFASTVGIPLDVRNAAKMVVEGKPFFCDAGKFNENYL